jgi:hypothetical protein
MRCFVVMLFLAGALDAERGYKSLFNGKNLEGWEVDTANIWSVQEGMIVGKSPGLKYNDFLRTKNSYRNFILKLSFLLVDGQGNSGVQFRSKPVPNSHEVSGYQADIGQQYWGCLYDESRRKKVLVQASPEGLSKLRRDGWNEYVITAINNHITLELNGVRTVDYTETESGIEQDGFLALQVHGGPPMEVHFEEIQIKVLK